MNVSEQGMCQAPPKKVSAEIVGDFWAVKKNKAGAWSRFNHAPAFLPE